MALLRPGLLEDELACSICFHLLCRPHSLLCGHTFCGQCIFAHERVGRAASCPVCRSPLPKQPPQVSMQLSDFIDRARASIPGESFLGETFLEWQARQQHWSERAQAEQGQWSGEGGGSADDSESSDISSTSDEDEEEDGEEDEDDEDEEDDEDDEPPETEEERLRRLAAEEEVRQRAEELERRLAEEERVNGHVTLRVRRGSQEVLMRLRKSTPMRKLMNAYCTRHSIAMRFLRFEFRSACRSSPRRSSEPAARDAAGAAYAMRVLRCRDTAFSLGMEEGDCINVRVVGSPGTGPIVDSWRPEPPNARYAERRQMTTLERHAEYARSREARAPGRGTLGARGSLATR